MWNFVCLYNIILVNTSAVSCLYLYYAPLQFVMHGQNCMLVSNCPLYPEGETDFVGFPMQNSSKINRDSISHGSKICVNDSISPWIQVDS